MRAQTAIGNRLRELRLEHDLKLREIAALVDRGESVIQRYENGQTAVPDEVKLALARRYDVSVDYLMGWDRVDEAAGA